MSEIPAGAMRFNSDSQKLEYWNGSAWFQVHTGSPDLASAGDPTPGARGIWGGGSQASPAPSVNTVEYVNISSTGDVVNFGDLTVIRNWLASMASSTRGVWAAGSSPGSTNTIDFVSIPTTGDATDFGDAGGNYIQVGGLSNQTRGIFNGGYNNVLEYITIASTGDAVDYGDLINSDNRYPNQFASPTRGVIKGGGFNPINSTVEFVTIASLGNSQVFGDLQGGTRTELGSGLSNSIRGLIAGGQLGTASPLTVTSAIDYLTIATTGNSQTFGDLSAAKFQMFGNGCASPTRGLFAGGGNPGPKINTIEYVNIMTLGDTVDFGDLSQPRSSGAGLSNAHGGL